MTQILSGELAFRLLKPNEAAFQGLSPLHLAELREFLARDCMWAQNDETRRQQKLREVGRSSMTCHVKRLVDGALVRDSIDSAVQMQMRLLEGECSRLLRELRKTQEVSDAHLLHQLAQYFALVKDELLTARVKLTADSIECQVQKRQAKTLRDVRIFAHHLFHETRGKVLLSALPRDSAQFKRCKKAVRDNTSKLFMTEMAYQQIKVLAVLKLEHSLISEYLQQLATNMDTGKVKGLFCIVPKGSLHAFCTYGLHAKSNIATGRSQAQAQAKLPQAMRDVVGLQDLFQTQWFRTPSNAVTGERESNSYSAEALANEGVQHMNRHSETRGDQGDWPLLYFSRNCTLSQLRDLSKRDLEEGVFLALSRVLMSRLRTINSLITSQDVKDALKTDHDALYSSVNEEYVLLKPEYVLPEFIMLVHFVSSSSASNGAYKGASAWIPSALVPRGGRIAARGGDGKEQKVVESMGEMLMSNHLQPTLAAAASSGVTPGDENDDDSAAPASERAAEKHALLVQLENSVAAVLAKQRILTRSAFQFVKGQRR